MDEIRFHPLTHEEIRSADYACPVYEDYTCGECCKPVHGRVIASANDERLTVLWTICSCGQPSCLILDGGYITGQWPMPKEYSPSKEWPEDLRRLFEEAALAFAGGAHTAVSMVCRKLLMVCACLEGDSDGKSFLNYVDFITKNVLSFPKAKTAIDKIRAIGNDANHDVAFVSAADAMTSLNIVKSLLDAIYKLPAG